MLVFGLKYLYYLVWPPESTDLNLIEDLWATVKSNLKGKNSRNNKKAGETFKANRPTFDEKPETRIFCF